MIFSQSWNFNGQQDKSPSVSKSIYELAEKGYEVELDRSEGNTLFRVLNPGWDRILLGRSFKMDWSPVMASWIKVAQKMFWDRAELVFDQKENKLTYRWIYWTPTQTFTHFIISILFILGKPLEMEPLGGFYDVITFGGILLIGNSIPLLISIFESQKMIQHLMDLLSRTGVARKSDVLSK